MKAGLMLAVNPEAEREENDFYATDPYAVYKMKDMFKEIGVDKNIWEPACGKGHISEALKKQGYNVKSTDIIDYGYPSSEIFDFLCPTKIDFNGDIITNPPFKFANEFIRKAMNTISDGHKALFLLKIQFLETTKRANLFRECGLKYVVVNSERVCCAKNGEFSKYFKMGENGAYKGGTQLYAWFVFEKGFAGEPVIKFV